MSLKNKDEIDYYINICLTQNLSKRELINTIKTKEYQRLDEQTKNKLINKETTEVIDFVKEPIIIKNTSNLDIENISEKVLQKLILEDLDSFLSELGSGFTYVGNEYKIKIGERYHHIDILLFNYIYNSFVVIELKVTELKASYIGQIQEYVNYVDKNIKTINQNKTIGIIICKKNNKFVMEFSTDERIISKEYKLVGT